MSGTYRLRRVALAKFLKYSDGIVKVMGGPGKGDLLCHDYLYNYGTGEVAKVVGFSRDSYGLVKEIELKLGPTYRNFIVQCPSIVNSWGWVSDNDVEEPETIALTAPLKGACTCGAKAVNSNMHAGWCDV